MNKHAPVITLDGPGGVGKGTISTLLAEKLGWHFLDSGALYRLTALAASNHGISLKDEQAVALVAEHLDVQFANDASGSQIILENEKVTEAIRTEEVGTNASIVAAYSRVRDALLKRQRAFAVEPGLIADGRDMGTVVFTDAPLKIFMNASAEERATRRVRQLQEKGATADYDTVLADIVARDERDQNRATAPLKPADDAVLLDTTCLSIDEVMNAILDEAASRQII
ncbi:(d)CMP kinase [Reinekea marinisedimentorum]|uniref:Cytidylate kinase n=1 Tax=Reinekea marinisedimentorum TaxID=230495 RepID=A0A4R3I327_9GAMM|nr:(d)CMP kinase [Reinekea marinisedimentorum]TCS39982.1 cytidylate kinase [Reinekea marinisedimentorum]